MDNDKTSRQGVNFCRSVFIDGDWKFREQFESDYGIDAHVGTTTERGPTGRLLALQIKSGESYFKEPTKVGWKRRFSDRHREFWLNHSLAVVIVLVDYERSIGYWEVVTERTVQKAKTNFYVEVPRSQQLDEKGLEKLKQLAVAEKPTRERGLTGSGPGQVFETDDFQWLPAYTPDGVTHALYPKEGSTAIPSVQFEFEPGQEDSLRELYERGVGGEFKAKILGSNFLPSFLTEDTVKVVMSDQRLKGAFPTVFYWIGSDGYRFQREIALQSTRAGIKEMVFESLIGQIDSLKLRFDMEKRQVHVDFTFKVAGCLAGRALEAVRFYASSMRGPGSISIMMKEPDTQIFSMKWEQREDEETLNSEDLLEKYLELEKYLGRPLKVPENWFEDSDVLGILETYSILTTGRLNLGNCKLGVPVGFELSEKMKNELDGAGNMALSSDFSRRTVAGYEFELGPCLTVVHDPVVVVEEMENHSFDLGDGTIARPFVINVPVRSRSGSVVQYFKKFLTRNKRN